MVRTAFTWLAQRTRQPMEIREFFLPRNSVLRIEDGAGVLVTVTLGCVWLTQEAEGNDRMLSSGSAFRLDRDGTCLATAFRHSRIALAAPIGEGRARTRFPARLRASVRAA